MTDLFETSLLLDFYGKLLTKSQYDCLDMYCNKDMSLAEIADELNISRQGVHDFIKRGKEALIEYENKLEIIARFGETKKRLAELKSELDMACLSLEDEAAKDIVRAAQKKIDDTASKL